MKLNPDDAEKLKDLDVEPRFVVRSDHQRPMIKLAVVYTRRSGKYFANHLAYDEVWPQTILAQWGSLGVSIWREVRRQMKAHLVFELFDSKNETQQAAQLNITKFLNSRMEEAFTKAAIQTILEREEEKKLARIA